MPELNSDEEPKFFYIKNLSTLVIKFLWNLLLRIGKCILHVIKWLISVAEKIPQYKTKLDERNRFNQENSLQKNGNEETENPYYSLNDKTDEEVISGNENTFSKCRKEEIFEYETDSDEEIVLSYSINDKTSDEEEDFGKFSSLSSDDNCEIDSDDQEILLLTNSYGDAADEEEEDSDFKNNLEKITEEEEDDTSNEDAFDLNDLVEYEDEHPINHIILEKNSFEEHEITSNDIKSILKQNVDNEEESDDLQNNRIAIQQQTYGEEREKDVEEEEGEEKEEDEFGERKVGEAKLGEEKLEGEEGENKEKEEEEGEKENLTPLSHNLEEQSGDATDGNKVKLVIENFEKQIEENIDNCEKKTMRNKILQELAEQKSFEKAVQKDEKLENDILSLKMFERKFIEDLEAFLQKGNTNSNRFLMNDYQKKIRAMHEQLGKILEDSKEFLTRIEKVDDNVELILDTFLQQDIPFLRYAENWYLQNTIKIHFPTSLESFFQIASKLPKYELFLENLKKHLIRHDPRIKKIEQTDNFIKYFSRQVNDVTLLPKIVKVNFMLRDYLPIQYHCNVEFSSKTYGDFNCQLYIFRKIILITEVKKNGLHEFRFKETLSDITVTKKQKKFFMSCSDSKKEKYVFKADSVKIVDEFMEKLKEGQTKSLGKND